jgi:hypothetical protein
MISIFWWLIICKKVTQQSAGSRKPGLAEFTFAFSFHVY